MNEWVIPWIKEWANWMRQDHAEVESMCGFKKSSAGFMSGGISSEDTFDHMVESADLRTIEIIDTCIRALGMHHYAALSNEYLFCGWTFRGDAKQYLAEAIDQVARMARKLGVE